MKMIVQLWRIYYGSKSWMLLGILLGAMTLIAGIVLMGLSGWFLASMGIAGLLATSINYFTPGAIIRAMAMTRTAGRYGERLLTHDATLRATTRLRSWLYDHIERLPFIHLNRLHSGDLFGRLRSDIETVEKFYLGTLVPFGIALITFIFVSVILLFYAPVLALWILALMLIVGLVLPLWLQHSSRDLHDKHAAAINALREEITETWQGAAELMVYGKSPAAATTLIARSTAIRDAQNALNKKAAISAAISAFLTNIAGIGGVVLMLPIIMTQKVTPAEIAALPLLCMACFDAVTPLPAALQTWHSVKLAAARLFDLAAAPITQEAAPALMQNFALRFNDVTFTYGAHDVLKNLSLTLAPGESLAITGPSGAGKSTLIALATGLLQPTAGTVSNSSDSEEWRAQFSVAEQRPHIFTGTLKQNLLLANPHASDIDIAEACSIAGLTMEIAALPHGIDTYLGEHGLGLSGGQLRRLSIARALLKPAQCLILDEPTDSIDEQAGQDIVTRILAYTSARDMAVMLITHNQHVAKMCGRSLKLA